jgi:hypothetical protein
MDELFRNGWCEADEPAAGMMPRLERRLRARLAHRNQSASGCCE